MASIDQQPPTTSDFLDAKMTEIRERIEELRPLVQEHDKLSMALSALGGPVEDLRPAAPKRRARSTK